MSTNINPEASSITKPKKKHKFTIPQNYAVYYVKLYYKSSTKRKFTIP